MVDSFEENSGILSETSFPQSEDGISRQIQTMSLRQGSPVVGGQAVPVIISKPQHEQGIYHSASLTTAALNRVHQNLFSEGIGKSDGVYGMDQSLKDVPIECVRFFRYLNETAQR